MEARRREVSEDELLGMLAETLGVDRSALGLETTADDVESWDSMGTMAIVLLLNDEFDLSLEPHETGRLQSVAGVLEVLREAGRIR